MNLPSASLGRYFASARRCRTRRWAGCRCQRGRRSYGEAALLGDVLGDDGGGDLVQLEAAVLLGDVDGGETDLCGLLIRRRVTLKSLASMQSEAERSR